MRVRLHTNLIAILLAPALLASGAAQGLLSMRCETVRMSCCCPKAAPPASSATLAPDLSRCCEVTAVPAAPAQNTERSVAAVSAPTLVAAIGPAQGALPAVERIRPVPSLDPPPGPSLLLANCALLI